jgi:hypothetical protein
MLLFYLNQGKNPVNLYKVRGAIQGLSVEQTFSLWIWGLILMSSRLFRYSLLGVVALAVAGLAYYLYHNSFYTLDLTRRDRYQAEEVVQSAFLMCQMTDRLLQKRESEIADQVQKALSVAGYPVLLDESQPWQVAIPGSPSTDKLTLPRMAVKTFRGHKRNLENLGEALRRFTGGEVTILQRVNEKGDHLAVYCSISGVESPAEPTSLIPARLGNGEKEMCLEKLDQGKTVLRPEFINGTLQVSYYYPIFADQKNIATLVVRVNDPDLERLRNDIIDLRIGQSGYVYALKGTGAHRGQYQISFNGERDGENIWNARDASGRPFIQSMINEALALKKKFDRVSVPIAFERYPWKNPGDLQPRNKSAAVVYFEPWDWVLGAGYYEDER